MRLTTTLACVLVFSTIPNAHAALTLASGGNTDYVIVVAPDAIPAEQTAARELAEHLKLVTGTEFPIRTEAAGAKQILVGAKQTANLGHDGIVIKTAGDTLTLSGSRPRGTLYAVNTFLE